jgi:hypothetical protein
MKLRIKVQKLDNQVLKEHDVIHELVSTNYPPRMQSESKTTNPTGVKENIELTD